ncbi:hypothetical protein, partial [Campylobacter concisus]|uniref:hypothetical protein n=1 Tax=Campylobacter concisus TaxID=199 RepID=UPI001CA53E31
LDLMRNLLICGLNAVNFNFRLPKFIPPFSADPYTSDLLKFDWIKPSSKVNLITLCEFINLWCLCEFLG